jgi:hypothetical protein
MRGPETNTNGAEALALRALVWMLSDQDRAARLLDVTGLTPADLKAGVRDPATLAAVLAYLEAHEPDLLAAAADLDTNPAALVRARQALETSL